MADIRVSWLALDTGSPPIDVRVSWLALDTGQDAAVDQEIAQGVGARLFAPQRKRAQIKRPGPEIARRALLADRLLRDDDDLMLLIQAAVVSGMLDHGKTRTVP